MLDERVKRSYDQLWHNRERERIARSKDARAEARKALADQIARDAEQRRTAPSQR